MSNDPSNLNPVALFKEEIGSEELGVRVNTIHRLPLILNLIASIPASKDQLFTILDSLIDSTDDDEVLFGLAQGLSFLSAFYPVQKLLVLYEKLLASEETIVREKTVESFLKMAQKLEKSSISTDIIPFISKLAVSQTFGAKMSVLSIMTDIFPILANEEKSIILEKIGQLFNEESLILRRNLASKIGKICKYLNKEILTVDIFNHFKTLTNDDSDSVRIITIESLIELAIVFNDEENKAYVIPIIIQMTGDKSWRVKLHLAKNFAKLAGAVGKDISDNSLISIFSTLLRDPENEVRVASIRSLKNFVNCLNIDKIPQIFAYLQQMSKDAIALVRVGVCEVLQMILKMDLEPLGKDIIKAKVQPILVDLNQEKDIEVKIEITKILPLWTKIVGTHITDLLANNTITLSMESPNWRLRYAVLDCYLNIAIELKNPKLFDKLIRKFVVQGMNDKCFQIRKHIIKSLKNMTNILDDLNFFEVFMKDYTKMAFDPLQFYSFRISALYGMEGVFAVLRNKDKVKDSYYKNLVKASEDQCVNVRQAAVRILANAVKKGGLIEFLEPVKNLFNKTKNSEKDIEIRFLIDEFLR